MDGIKDWAFETTRVGDAVRFRPASLDAFYRMGCDPWSESGITLRDLCERRGMPPQELIEELSALPVPEAGTAWESRPAHILIDYLTAQHRGFIHTDLPALRGMLEMPFGKDAGSGFHQVMLDAFNRLSDDLRRHVADEEETFYPAILRNEHLLRRGPGGTESLPVADRMFAASKLMHGEDELDRTFDAWEKLAQAGTVAATAAQALRDFGRRLRAHAHLERSILYPMAIRIENRLAQSAGSDI